MKMLTKFESKSSRAKGIAFHPSRPLALVTLFSSTIQLWDYRMGTLLHKFEDHEGPVRGVDFHPTQPLFVSAGDDSIIRVWSLDTKQCLYSLSGHLDYIRTVYFHTELPWIISASDDQTIRIWNWQNRKEIACLTGHNHFVMSAQFHPGGEDLVVSSSLDETVRVWDISGLRKKHSAPMHSHSMEQLAQNSNSILDGSGFGDCVVKFILEGHTRGVNWASFHPKLPLIVSGGDDHQVKLWRMSSTRAWEVDTCRGHTNNINAVLFHPFEDLIISVSEDKTIRCWDLNKRTPVKQFKRENDRFWMIAAHPHINLFGAVHDSGCMVFKLDRERPPFAVNNQQKQLIYVDKEKNVKTFDYRTKRASLPFISLKTIGETWNNFRSISYNPANHSLLVNTGSHNKFALVGLPKEAAGAVEPSNVINDTGLFATFVTRNRFAIYDKASESIEIRDLSNKKTRSIKMDSSKSGSINDIINLGPGLILILKNKFVTLYDIQQDVQVAELKVSNVKYVTVSQDGQYFALLSKHGITLVTASKLELINSIHETIRIKSAVFDENNVLIFSTLNHIKYCLLNGETGIIKTLENTIYLTRIEKATLYALNRSGQVEVITIDPTEYRFKKALVNQNFNEVLRIIKTSNLVGQNIIGYLQKSGYPEVALQFVTDPEIRFELALEDSNLQVALEEVLKLNDMKLWERLGQAAIKQGNIKVYEQALQKLQEFDKLSFLYLSTGNTAKLGMMSKIGERRNDLGSILLNSFYLNDVEKRSQIFAEQGSLPLSFALAHSNNFETGDILEAAGVEESEVVLPDGVSMESFVPQAAVKEPVAEWPLKEAELSYFEKAILGTLEELDINDENEESELIESSNDLIEDDEDEQDLMDEDLDDDDSFVDAAADGEGWGDEDLIVSDVDDIVASDEDEGEDEAIAGVEEATSAKNVTETSKWVSNSKLPAVLVAAGAFEAASQALNKQLGIVNFEPLKDSFLNIYESSKLYLPSNEIGLPHIKSYVRADNDEEKELPFIPGVDTINKKISLGFKYFKSNNLEEAIKTFQDVIKTVILVTVDNEEDLEKAEEALRLSANYVLGLNIELERRKIATQDIKRNLELASYFTTIDLLPQHKINSIQVAMVQSFKNKNFLQASIFASQLIELCEMTGNTAKIEQAEKIKAKSDSIAHDSINVEFDQYSNFDICPYELTPIYSSDAFALCPLTGFKYHKSTEGKLDCIVSLAKIGGKGSGLRIML
ncbi:coatomer subunit alpha [Hanseniaspora valbyensis]